ncbi:RNA polymerase sigma factor [Crateriforma conspicua]|uniref:Sigma-70 region 2 n=1 Tax=Crateriforma conspicua TaxID=2527996 RepID=A0A5C6FJ76_9PLAN|nr:sigma factor [Crateriforma conspicua]TWU62295.1 Sigma-70 region 2 [Crateriforma conspicua]
MSIATRPGDAKQTNGKAQETCQRLGEDILTDFAMNFARMKAEQLCPRPEFADCDPEDVAQDLLMYLIQRADKFDPARGKLHTFIGCIIDSGVREILRAKKRQKRYPREEEVWVQSFEETVETVDETFANLGDEVWQEDLSRRTRGGHVDQYQEIDERDAIEVAMSRLTPEMRQLVLFMSDHSLNETMRKFGLSRRQLNKRRTDLQEHFKAFDAGFFWE